QWHQRIYLSDEGRAKFLFQFLGFVVVDFKLVTVANNYPMIAGTLNNQLTGSGSKSIQVTVAGIDKFYRLVTYVINLKPGLRICVERNTTANTTEWCVYCPA